MKIKEYRKAMSYVLKCLKVLQDDNYELQEISILDYFCLVFREMMNNPDELNESIGRMYKDRYSVL